MSYVQPLPAPLAGAFEEESSRTCTVTGLRVFANAQALTLANAVAAVLSLAIGGIFGVLIGVSRAPAFEFLGDGAYYAAMTGHGVGVLILWPVFFEVAAMVFASSVLLNARVFSAKLGWASFALMTTGGVLILGVIVTGNGSVGFTAYPPLTASPLFYLGYLAFAVGTLAAIVNFALTLAMARAEKTYEGSLPLLAYGVAVAAILALLSIVSGLVALVPALLYAQGWISSIEPIVYRGWFWGLGHTLQYVNVVATVVCWYGIAALALKAGPVNQKFTRLAFILYLLISFPVLGHHFLVDPSITTEVKLVGGTLMGFALGVPSLMHGLALMGGVEATIRRQGRTSLFGWLRKIRWSHPGIAAISMSLLLFAIGGWSGTAQTTLQLNLLSHNTMWVPAHVHQIVSGGTTLAFMGFAYMLVPLLARRALISQRWATIQIYGYAFGLFFMSTAQSWAGTIGVPRRVASIAYGGAAPDSWTLPMNLAGIGSAFAGVTGSLFIVLMVLTLLKGKRTENPDELVPSALVTT